MTAAPALPRVFRPALHRVIVVDGPAAQQDGGGEEYGVISVGCASQPKAAGVDQDAVVDGRQGGRYRTRDCERAARGLSGIAVIVDTKHAAAKRQTRHSRCADCAQAIDKTTNECINTKSGSVSAAAFAAGLKSSLLQSFTTRLPDGRKQNKAGQECEQNQSEFSFWNRQRTKFT